MLKYCRPVLVSSSSCATLLERERPLERDRVRSSRRNSSVWAPVEQKPSNYDRAQICRRSDCICNSGSIHSLNSNYQGKDDDGQYCVIAVLRGSMHRPTYCRTSAGHHGRRAHRVRSICLRVGTQGMQQRVRSGSMMPARSSQLTACLAIDPQVQDACIPR